MAPPAGQALFQPVRLTPYLNAPRQVPSERWEATAHSTFADLPGGRQRFWDRRDVDLAMSNHRVTASVTNDDPAKPGVVAAWQERGARGRRDRTPDLAARKSPSYLVFLHVSEVPQATAPPWQLSTSDKPPPLWLAQTGAQVASYTLVYGDGSGRKDRSVGASRSTAAPVRSLTGQHRTPGPTKWTACSICAAPIRAGAGQTIRPLYSVAKIATGCTRYPTLVPRKHLRAVRLAAPGPAVVGIAGITLTTVGDHPLRHRALESFPHHVPLRNCTSTIAGTGHGSRPAGYECRSRHRRARIRPTGIRSRDMARGHGDDAIGKRPRHPDPRALNHPRPDGKRRRAPSGGVSRSTAAPRLREGS